MPVFRTLKDVFGLTGKLPRVPDNTRLYVVGDIHGRADLLGQMLDLMRADMAADSFVSTVEVFLGDYLDRGPNSRSVVEMLSSSLPLGNKRVCLKGNHEQAFLDFLDDPTNFSDLVSLGGFETLVSYGLRPKFNLTFQGAKELCAEVRAVLPVSHEKFLRHLPLTFACGDYFFVHAGVRPGLGLDAQQPEDLLWIRDPFLDSISNFGAYIVHGHTPAIEPVILPNRMCIDTGAFATGRLTCLVLQGSEQRFLHASTRNR